MSRLTGLVQGYRDRDQLTGMIRSAGTIPEGLSRTELMNAQTRREQREFMAGEITRLVGSYGPLETGELAHAAELMRRTR
ncbi:MAG: hypothetical protein IPG45_34585 [Deltaproteobacteria bacterium]|jgi:hypothetical protein|nr:hypothetical protein [Deltaproteobacteria bacterium]